MSTRPNIAGAPTGFFVETGASKRRSASAKATADNLRLSLM
jgi:hypothetical protein